MDQDRASGAALAAHAERDAAQAAAAALRTELAEQTRRATDVPLESTGAQSIAGN